MLRCSLSEPDTDAPQSMGDPSKTEISEEDQDKFSTKRSEALSAFSEGEWQKAVDLVRNLIADLETKFFRI